MSLTIQFGKIQTPLANGVEKTIICNVVYNTQEPQPFRNTVIDYNTLTDNEKIVFDNFKILLENKIADL